jgi:hypothetical protein
MNGIIRVRNVIKIASTILHLKHIDMTITVEVNFVSRAENIGL